MNKFDHVVTRFAPSPTGLLHGGNYRTAVFSYLFARRTGGKFILRIEDTDKARSKKEYEDNILESLQWLGLEHDAFFRQSERLPRHAIALERLIASGHAYLSKEAAKDGSGAERELVRFRNPKKVVTFRDLVKGDITIDTSDLGDFVIARTMDEPLFHLAVVVDDAEMGVTHIVRGEDHIANTPRQILLYEALGFPIPSYAHLPLVLDASRQKLSKRRGAQPLTYYRDLGYLPEALLNFLALTGWNPGTEKEIFTRDELREVFELARVQTSPGIFNPEKLEWINKEHMKRLSEDERLSHMRAHLPDAIRALPEFSEERFARVARELFERITHFGAITELAGAHELDFYFAMPELDATQLIWKKLREEPDGGVGKTREHLEKVLPLLTELPEASWSDPEALKAAVWPYADANGRGDVLWPLRYALSSKERSPDPFQLAFIFGKTGSIARIERAIASLHA
ncbi:MAG TPA: glutamate--tRNA ligase family protein [Candidatus Paceibacterota bacterium]|nr:glutamate--tRNA ligase family protein [Candidatus Paceibacterota bacterium]